MVFAPTLVTVSGEIVKPLVIRSFVLSLLVISTVILEGSIFVPTTRSTPVYFADIFSAVFAIPFTESFPVKLPYFTITS